ncbi:MAG: TIGR01459 family HAD-type hydrolase [Caulobacterales bacterium]
MTSPRLLNSLDDIAADYDAILCDVWGVVHDGVKLFQPGIAALKRYRASGKPVILVSNAPVPGHRVRTPISNLGGTDDFYDAIVTSGDVTRAELSARAPGPAFRIGPSWDDALFEGLGLEFAGLEKAAFIACSALNDDNETPEDYRDVLTKAAARKLDFVSANPDIVVKVGDKLFYCAGALARLYEQMGGKVIQAGKPYAPIYQAAMRKVKELSGDAPTSRVLTIGDSAATDVKGANGQGFANLFIAHGIHGHEFDVDGPLDVEALGQLLEKSGVRSDYAMRELA